MKKTKKSKAFTLIEMLVVIVIIGILAAILIYSVSGARQKANAARAKADVMQVKNVIEKASSVEGCSTFDFTNAGNATTLSCGTTSGTIQLPSVGTYVLTISNGASNCTNTGTTSSWTKSASGCPTAGMTSYTLQATGFKNGATYTCTPAGCSCSSATAGDCDTY